MKLCICPICGRALVERWDFGDIRWIRCTQDDWCDECNKEIVPLVTPQEVENESIRM